MKNIAWLPSRKRLVFSVVVDLILFVGLYVLVYYQLNNAVPGFDLPSTWLLELWIILSYIFGRYYDYEFEPKQLWCRQLVSTLIVFIIATCLYLSYNYVILYIAYSSDSKTFILPLLIILAPLSGFLQYSIQILIRNSKYNTLRWICLGTSTFSSDLEVLSSNSRYSHVFIDYRADIVDMDHYFGVIIEDSVSNLQHTLYIQSQFLKKNYLVLTASDWAKYYLQYYPVSFLIRYGIKPSNFNILKSATQIRIKRLADIVVASIFLILSIPVILFFAILIYLEDRGPIFYAQIRTGLYGKPFKIWKLRSMVVNAEAAFPQWSTKADPRVTRIGRFIRMTRIDELPQLVQIILGTMTLIGPRPERPIFDSKFYVSIPYYRLKYMAKPGLTGWTQVNCNYGASIEDSIFRFGYDIYYLENFSIFLDLLVLVKTCRLIINAKKSEPSA